MRTPAYALSLIMLSFPAFGQGNPYIPQVQLDIGRALQQGTAARANQAAADAMRAQAEAQQAATAAENRRQVIRTGVGSLAAHGDCAGAVKLALSAGEIELAQQIKDLCVPSQTPAQ